MKRNSEYLWFLLFLACVFSHCVVEDEEKEIYETKGAIPVITDVINGFYDLADPENASIGFTIDTDGEQALLTTIYLMYNGSSPFEYETVELPANVTIPLRTAVEVAGTQISDLQIGDEFVFIFEVETSSGLFTSIERLSILASCASNLGGTFDFVTNPWCEGETTGSSAWIEINEGAYTTVDFTYGAYRFCYWPEAPFPGGSLMIRDVCNRISFEGLDQWGGSYSISAIEVNGPQLTFDWNNSYGEYGTTTLTRKDSKDWPDLSD